MRKSFCRLSFFLLTALLLCGCGAGEKEETGDKTGDKARNEAGEKAGKTQRLEKEDVLNDISAALCSDVAVSAERFFMERSNTFLEINGLTLGNPEGFSPEGFSFKFGDIIADIDADSVSQDKIRIKHLRLKDIDVVYERGWTGSNLEEIMSRLKAAEREEGLSRLETAEREKKEKKTGKKVKRFQVDMIEIENVGVSVKIKGLPGNAPIHVSTDPLEDLGADGEGVTATDLAYVILGEIIRKALALDAISDAPSAAGEAISGASASANDALNDAAASVNEALNDGVARVSDALNDAAASANDAVRNALDGLNPGIKTEGETPARSPEN